MKRVVSVALVATLALAMFLGVGHAQTAPDPLQQELATMEAVFTGLESFMGELIREIKGSMADITGLGTDLGDLRNVVAVICGGDQDSGREARGTPAGRRQAGRGPGGDEAGVAVGGDGPLRDVAAR